MKDRLIRIEKSIEAFIALHVFHKENKYEPPILKKRSSISRKHKSELSIIDPLLGSAPQGYEDELKCLQEKYKLLKQKFYSIDNLLNKEKPDAFMTEKENIYSRIDEAFQIAKNNKKKIRETQNTFSKVNIVFKIIILEYKSHKRRTD